MPRRKTWTQEHEKQLMRLVAEGYSISEIAEKMEKTYASVATKMRRLNISQDDNNRNPAELRLLSSPLKLPEDLPSVEMQLRVLAGAINELQRLVENGASFSEVSRRLSRSPEAIRAKAKRLGLDDNEQCKNTRLLSSDLQLPEDLPSIEEALLKLAAAMKALEKPGLSKTEIVRLRALIQATGSYQKKFADYINYRKIEQRVIEATEELERLAKREQERADKPRITGKGFTRSRTSLHNGARPASFIRPNNQAKGKEVTTKE